MKILAHSLVIVMGAGLGLAIGFALRGKASVEGATAPATSAASTGDSLLKSAQDVSHGGGARSNEVLSLAAGLERNLSLSTGVTRWLYWLEAVEQAGPRDFPQLYRMAQGNPAAARLVSDRWIELYPRQVFDVVITAFKEGRGSSVQELSNQLFQEWPKRDPEAAIAALNQNPDFGAGGARYTVAAAVIDKDPERGLRLFCEWHIENFGPRMDGITKWAAADPRHAAEFALANPSGFVSQLTLKTIGEEWAKTDPAAALAFAGGRSDGLAFELASAALKVWAARNFNDAAGWLGKADQRARSLLSPSFVETWAKQDAAAALTWCEANLTGRSLTDAVGGLMKGAAEKDVAGAAALVNSLSPSPARTEAAEAVARKWFPDPFTSNVKTVAPEAIAWVSGLDRDSLRRVLDEIHWQWSGTDLKGLASFLAGRSSDQVPENVYAFVAREMAHKNPTEALEWANHLPEDRAISAGADAFAEWRRTQADAAMNWFNALPSSDPRRAPYFRSAVRSLVWDAQADGQFAAMSPDERSIARSVVEEMTTLPKDRRAQLLETLKTN